MQVNSPTISQISQTTNSSSKLYIQIVTIRLCIINISIFFLWFILLFPFPCIQAKSSNWMMRNHFNLISDMTEGQKYYFTCNKKNFLFFLFLLSSYIHAVYIMILIVCCFHLTSCMLWYISCSGCDSFSSFFLLDMKSAFWLSKFTLKYT